MKFVPEHIGLAARNPVALKDWYVRVLGAKLALDPRETPPAFFVALPGGLILEIYQSDFGFAGTSDNKLAGWRHLALGVENIESAKAALEANGVVFTEPIKPAGGGGRVLYFRDGEGNLLHLVERPKPEPDWMKERN